MIISLPNSCLKIGDNMDKERKDTNEDFYITIHYHRLTRKSFFYMPPKLLRKKKEENNNWKKKIFIEFLPIASKGLFMFCVHTFSDFVWF